ncbi:hypothetical protein FMM68_11200 [Lachnospiraceae bacterium MD329]|nr:hypothetical protein [Lachnospiraceae bacterium MD329]
MIKIRDCEIMDILPYTFKTPRWQALSKAFLKVRAMCYDTMSSVLFWGDIENADPALLDAMAAELSAPFYSMDMSIEQKRSITAAAFAYNSRIGTVSSIQGLLTAAFGGGKISEWYEYGGDPYYFKIDINGEQISPTLSDFKYFSEMIRKIKNVRSKLEGLNVKLNTTQSDIYAGAKVVGIKRTLPKVEAAEIPRESEVLSGVAIGAKVAGIKRTLPKVDAMQYNTYEDIKKYSNDEIKNKTYLELLYKQEEK